MRIVGGNHRGRPLSAPKGSDTRPTSGRAREAIFSILNARSDVAVAGARIADIFCGSGAMGLEALSRGAAHCTFIDNAKAAIDCARINAATFGEGDKATCLKLDVTRLPPPARPVGAPLSLVFLDPPYNQGLGMPALLGLKARGWLAEGAMVVLEVGATEDFEAPPGFALIDERRYGAAKILFLKYGLSEGPTK